MRPNLTPVPKHKTSIKIKQKTYNLPVFLPDATRAVVKSLDSDDLRKSKVDGIVVNTLHLTEKPGLETLNKIGGVKKLMNFGGLVASDSGGWQIFSLLHKKGQKGQITSAGVNFNNSKVFTPEESIRMQMAIDPDIVVVLDDFSDNQDTYANIKLSVDRTIVWAERSKAEYEKQCQIKGYDENSRPKILAVIQGGFYKELRKYCADELIKLNFDGFGYGGYAVVDGSLDMELSKFISDLIPDKYFKFALGNGRPLDIANLAAMGWDIFDCTLPTRDARHKRLYVFNKAPLNYSDLLNPETYGFVYINKSKHQEESFPLEKGCDCHTCTNFTRSYLHHLFNIGDISAYRLAAIHNLRHYTKLIEYIRLFKES